jgi:ornithine cyclodeaminase/alanine dehydrogenase-like protein (mu-crystallin family)
MIPGWGRFACVTRGSQGLSRSKWAPMSEVSGAVVRRLVPMSDAIDAVRNAFVLTSRGRCDLPMRCATLSTAPRFWDSSVKDDAHINAVGAFRQSMCELQADLLGRAAVIAIDQREAALEEAGDLIQAIAAGAISIESLVEIGALLAAGGRDCNGGPTLFKSLGIASQDWAIADLIRSRVGVN